jgi:hypothetical protein
VGLLDLSNVWQLHTPMPAWGLAELRLPAGWNAQALLDGARPPQSDAVHVVGFADEVSDVGDVVATGWASLVLISPATQAALAPFVGWNAVPVVGSEPRLRGYALLGITGRVGPVTRPDSGLGMFLNPTTWDGSDIFKPENRRGVWMIERVARSLSAKKLSGLEVEHYVGWEALP